MEFKTQFKTLTKKNLLLKKKNCIGICCEIVFPLVIIALLLLILGLIQRFKPNYDEHPLSIFGAVVDPTYKLLYTGSGVDGALTAEEELVVGGLKLQVSLFKQISMNETDDYFMAFNSTDDMEAFYLANSDLVMGGIAFENDVPSSASSVFKYSIRVDADNVNDDTETYEKDYDSSIYRTDGFSYIQAGVDQAIFISQGVNATLEVNAQYFPDPWTLRWQKWINGRNSVYKDAGVVFLTAAFAIYALRLITELVIEKETKIREGMKMMGLNQLAYSLSWLVTSLIISFPVMVLIFLILRGSEIIYHTSYGVVFVLFLLYLLTILLSSFIFTSFFDKSKFAGIISFVVILLLSIAGIFVAKGDMPPGVKYFLSLFSPIGMANAMYSMAVKDLTDVLTVDPDILTTEGGIIGMFLVDIVLYIIIAWYFDNVVPTEFGTKRKWYFPVQPSYWFPKKVSMDPEANDNNDDFEMVPIEYRSKTTVSIRGLTKVYNTGDGKRTAVNKLSLDFYEDQIHAYLGHNGSGKSTTIGLLTGLTSPTSGDAIVGGYSIANQLSEVRKVLGVCPQQDILWSSLTVLEHLVIYASLKGVTGSDIKSEAKKMAVEVGLGEKINAPSSTLSGGQKRKLCLGIAFIGRSKIIFIDEATSGMDPLSRRGVWDFLLKYKKGRTIVLTTHFMDEADFLGDRIAIISHGQLRCVGSSLYLKNRFGVGYLLTCSKIQGSCVSDNVTEFVHSHIPEATILSDVGTELSYRLPTNSISQFAAFFRKLEEIKRSLGIEFYGISVTTLEEVFLRLGKQTSLDKSDFNINSNEGSSENELLVKQSISHASTGRKAAQQLKGLLIKRIITSAKDFKGFLLTILLPLVVVIGSIIVYLKVPKAKPFYNDITTPLLLDMGSFGNTTIPVNYLPDSEIDFMKNSPYASEMVYFTDEAKFNDYMIEYYKLPGSLDFTSGTLNASGNIAYNAYYGQNYLHSIPIFINYANSAILKNLTGVAIQTTSKPFQHVLTEFQQAAAGTNMQAVIYFVLLFMAGYGLMAGSFAGNITTERIGRIKRLLYISGCKKYVYWLSNLIWDYFFALLLLVIISIIMACVDSKFRDNFGLIFLGQILYCIGIIPLAYLLSYKYTTHGKSTAAVFGNFFGVAVCMIIVILNTRVMALVDQSDNLQLASDILDYIFYAISPLYCLGKIACYVCDFSILYRIGDYQVDNLWTWNYGGAPIFFLAIHCVVWTSWVIILDYMPEIKGHWKNPKSVTPPAPGRDEDSDVQAERQKVEHSQNLDEVLIIKNLHKQFPAKGKNPSKNAVYNSTLAIPKGQCFGLLGMNGAGKTTTLSMLSGDILPTAGSMSVNGYDVITNRSQALESIGSCPQFDSLVPLLSARQQLALYCRIKGVPEHLINSVVEGFVSMMDLKAIANSNCIGYSGGNKRKVSLSIAMLGGPSIVYLDECSTGCDPAVRRFIWNVVSELSKDKVIILTTHSMEECEALCQRVTIMKDGKLTCLGSNQHIKSKFGSGYSVDIKFKKEYLETGIDIILKELSGSVLLDKHDLIANFELKNTPEHPVQVSEIFDKLQNNLRYLLDDFSVSQLSLEQVFLKLTGSGYQDRLAIQSETPTQPTTHDFDNLQ